MKKKILYVITKSNLGGAQRYVFDMAGAMKAKGYEVAVALGGEGILKEKLDASGIRTISIASLGKDISLMRDSLSLFSLYKTVRHEQPDILHLNSPKASGLGALVGRVLKIKNIVHTVHGWTFNEDRPLLKRAAIRIFSWMTMLLCHKIVVLSHEDYTQGARFPFAKKKLTTIPLGVGPLTFIPREDARQELGKIISCDISHKTVIGTIAELHPNKGLTYLLHALAHLKKNHPELACVIIGDGQEKSALESLIKEKGLEHTAFLTGYRNEASKYLKAFDVFVLPSTKEGLPYVVLEAGLASLPVVSTMVGGIPEIVRNKKTGILVPPKDIDKLTESLTFMCAHLKERIALGEALEALVKSQFSLGNMIEKTGQLYRV